MVFEDFTTSLMPPTRASKQRALAQGRGDKTGASDANITSATSTAVASKSTGLRAQLDAKQAELDALQADHEEFRLARQVELEQAQLRIAAAEEERDAAEEERDAVEVRLATIPAAPTPPPIFSPPPPPMPNVILPSGSDLLAGCVNDRSKIPKPKGSAGKNWNLRDKMGMSDFGDQYKAIHRTVLRLVAQANLDPATEYRHQDVLLIGAICRAAEEEHPFLTRFVRPATWPVLEMIKVLLRNQRAYLITQGGHHPVLNTDLSLQPWGIDG